MAYIDGFVIPAPTANKDKFIDHAKRMDSVFLEFGARRIAECWGDDVPAGKVTDFQRAVQAKADETVVFSWIEWPDKATRDAAMEKLRNDQRMMSEPMPFDGKRMIFGGFVPIVDEGVTDGAGGYTDGFVVPVPDGNREAYRAMSAKAAPVFKEYGATRHVEAWGDDVPEGQVTDFRRSVQAKDGEKVVFSFVEWPDRATRDEGWKKVMADERMKPDKDMPFDGQRMFWGGFASVVDLKETQSG